MTNRLADSRAVRALCTIGVVVATVATSEAEWQLTDSLEARSATLGPGESTTRRFRAVANVPETATLAISADLRDLGATEGRMQVFGSCGYDQTYDARDDGWCRADSAGPCSPLPRFELCTAAGDHEITIVNQSRYPLSFHWTIVAVAEYEGEDDVPEGASVSLEELP